MNLPCLADTLGPRKLTLQCTALLRNLALILVRYRSLEPVLPFIGITARSTGWEFWARFLRGRFALAHCPLQIAWNPIVAVECLEGCESRYSCRTRRAYYRVGTPSVPRYLPMDCSRSIGCRTDSMLNRSPQSCRQHTPGSQEPITDLVTSQL